MNSLISSANRLTAYTLGVRLVLWLGPYVPLPAPKWLSDALISVEVHRNIDRGSGFTMQFRMEKTMLLDYDLLFTSKLSADSRVVLAIQVGFMPEQLINGVITHHSVSVSPTPGESVITVTGVDVEGTMDRVRKTQQTAARGDTKAIR